jgi:hypothetical protein
MMWPGTCPACGGRGLEGMRGPAHDYLLCQKCGWKSQWLNEQARNQRSMELGAVAAVRAEAPAEAAERHTAVV